MGISPIKKLEESDKERLLKAANRFLVRNFGANAPQHFDFNSAMWAVDVAIACAVGDDSKVVKGLRRKWKQALCRAVRLPYDIRMGIAYGQIGPIYK
jgi:hypothetical protein